MRISLCAASALTLALLAVPVAAQQTFVVDAGGGGQFTDIQPAVDAAVAGDTVLVRAGTYGNFSITGKGITVLGDPGAQVVGLFGGFGIAGVPLGQSLVVRGVSTSLTGALPIGGVTILGCPGQVHLEDLSTDILNITSCERICAA